MLRGLLVFVGLWVLLWVLGMCAAAKLPDYDGREEE